MILRRFRTGDRDGCAAVFRAAVLTGAAGFYDTAQRRVWAEGARGDGFSTRLADQVTIVAEAGGVLRGFMSLRADGCLDLAYVHPGEMGRGLAARLLDEIIRAARTMGLSRLTTEASHPARRFFLKHGWREDAAQSVERAGVTLENFRMSCTVTAANVRGRS